MLAKLRHSAASGFQPVVTVLKEWSQTGTIPRAPALRRAALLALSFFTFVTFSIFAFSRNYAELAYGTDGVHTFVSAIHAWTWAPARLGVGANPFEGMSYIWSGQGGLDFLH